MLIALVHWVSPFGNSYSFQREQLISNVSLVPWGVGGFNLACCIWLALFPSHTQQMQNTQNRCITHTSDAKHTHNRCKWHTADEKHTKQMQNTLHAPCSFAQNRDGLPLAPCSCQIFPLYLLISLHKLDSPSLSHCSSQPRQGKCLMLYVQHIIIRIRFIIRIGLLIGIGFIIRIGLLTGIRIIIIGIGLLINTWLPLLDECDEKNTRFVRRLWFESPEMTHIKRITPQTLGTK